MRGLPILCILPSRVMVYLKEIVTFRALRYLGHNPAGGAMIVALLVTFFISTLTGMVLQSLEEGTGPFTGSMLSNVAEAGEERGVEASA
jgi:cytochrome b